MNEFYLAAFILFFIYFINQFFKKKNLIPNYTGNNHQILFKKKNIPLSGGFFLLIILSFVLFDNQSYLLIYLAFFYLLGLFSDLNFFSSAKIRFIIQFFLLLSLIINSDISIKDIKIEFINFYLRNTFLSVLFTVFCLMILINGTNFIDGLNCLVLNYYLIIIFVLIHTGLLNYSFLSETDIFLIIYLIFFLIIFNFFNQLYLGDSGSYIFGAFFGYLFLTIYSLENSTSPYFFSLLLWYPAFEILFSIIRKLNSKKSPFKPDNFHFHQLLYIFIFRNFKMKKNNANNFSSIMINFYNFIIFSLATLNTSHSLYLISLTVFSIFVYVLIYLYLIKAINN